MADPVAIGPVAGIPLWDTFASDTHQWLVLLSSWTPVLTVATVSDVTAFEPTDGSYGRLTASSEMSTPTPGVGIVHTADDPVFLSQAGGEAWAWAVLAEDTGTDASDRLMGLYRISRVTDGGNVTLTVASAGLATQPIGLA